MTDHGNESASGAEPSTPQQPQGQQPWLHDLSICVDGNGTALSDPDGSMTGRGAHGFFVDDERVVSLFTMTLGGARPVKVAHSSRGARSEFFTSARGLGDPGPDPTVELHRHRLVAGGALRETVRVASRASSSVDVPLVIRIGGDGADIGPVKAGVATGELLEAHVEAGPPAAEQAPEAPAAVSWQTEALRTVVTFSPAPATLEVGLEGVTATFPLSVAAGSQAQVEVEVRTERLARSHFPADSGSDAVDWPESLRVDAGDPRLARLLDTSLADLRSLLLRDPVDSRDVFAAAGTPWYLTLFGRDSLWTARMMLPLGTDLAAGTLRSLARRQGTGWDPETAEAPGKIPHELRRTTYEDATVDFTLPTVYWGTVDATALWICLLHDAWRWGMPSDDVRSLLPELRAAASWLTEIAVPGEDGFIQYVDESGRGLANQGWKDSGDSMRFRDGTLATAPIALVEAQAYAVEAAMDAAALLRELGDLPASDAARAAELEGWAGSLSKRIRSSFWVGPPEQRYLAMAIDGTARPVDGVGSNMGHALGTGALTPSEAQQVTDLLVSRTMLGDFGIMTLASDNGGFNPIGYHTGSVWVHDTAICALGMAREGHAAEAASVVSALLDLGEAFGYRFPELLADPATIGQWAPYPASCRPQAWAAASAMAMLTVALGVTVDVPGRRMTVRPPSPLPFGALTVSGLRVGEATVSVAVDALGAVTVEGLPADFSLELPEEAAVGALVATV
ncbi:glycogen debranching N-terminal domain-containing protein [Terrabacter sp. NPDC080008]|uniref:glycogen debranching N-terminal domain-containing protein n=1 Tax=Terrabacter sp. NPDC080008 TaxID=3155176 RepID=UPI00344EAB1C